MSSFIGSLTGSKAASDEAKQQAASTFLEQQRQAAISAAADNVNSTFNNTFTPQFYDQQKQNYLAYATPQLDKQYADAQKQLTFALDRSGTLDSSARGKQQADLQANYDANQQTLASNANAAAQSTEGNVEAARSNLIAALSTSGDTSAATNNASYQAAQLSAPQSYSPLGDLFSTTTSALSQQAALDKQNAIATGALYSSPYTLGLNRASSAVVNR